MRRLFLFALVLAVAFPLTAEAKRKHVRIYKPAPAGYQPGAVPLVAVPPLAVAFDLVRRTTCDPRLAVSTGKGDPGFDLDGPMTGNFLIPAIWARCATRPQPKF